MNRGRANAAERTEIGEQIRRARAAGTPWKILQRRFGYCRTRLWMLARDADEQLIPTDLPAARTVTGASLPRPSDAIRAKVWRGQLRASH
jgi:hypothetical protein